MKKKTAILSLAFASALIFGGSTLPSSQQTEAISQLDSTLSRLESYTNMSYDFENPQNMLLGDDYFLFYENGNYNLSNTRSYLFYNGYMLPSQNSRNLNNNYSQNENLSKSYTLRNTPQNKIDANANQTDQNYKNNSQSNTNTSMNMTQNYSQNNTNQSKASINPTQTNYETVNSNYSYTKNTNSSNISAQNSNLSSTTAQNTTLGNTNLTNQSNQNSYLKEINKTTSLNENSTQTNDYQNYETDFGGINQTLRQNIQSLRQNIQNSNQNVNMRTLRAYSYTLNNITNKIEMEQSELMNSLNKIAIIGSNQDYNEVNDAIKLNLKATLKSRLVLMECANEAIANLNSLYASPSNTNIQISNQNSQSNTQSTSNSQNQSNNTNATTQSLTNNQNSGNITNQSNQNNQNYAMTNSYQNSMNGPTTSTNTTTASAKAFFDENESVATPQITKESKQKLNDQKHFQKKLGSKM